VAQGWQIGGFHKAAASDGLILPQIAALRIAAADKSICELFITLVANDLPSFCALPLAKRPAFA
jgi:hypothetical protein